MLRSDIPRSRLWIPFSLIALVGLGAALLVVMGNPGNMGICGVCFLRDISGALFLFTGEGPKIFRPEVVGIMLGAMIWMMARGKFQGRSGSFAVTKFFIGIWMAFGALVFLGCPFRMLQRIAGGDLNAIIGAVGFIGGVGIGVFFESRGYKAGKTDAVPFPVGLLGTLSGCIVLLLFICGFLAGPGISELKLPPPHAFWVLALVIGLIAGAAMSATGFCAITAARQVFLKPKRMLIAAGILIATYSIVIAISGRFKFGFAEQPAAHTDLVWSCLSLMLVGLTGVLAGGCPVRQIVIAGEGNGDAFVTVCGLLVGSALAHNFDIVSSSAGVTLSGKIVVMIGLVLMIAYATAIVVFKPSTISANNE